MTLEERERNLAALLKLAREALPPGTKITAPEGWMIEWLPPRARGGSVTRPLPQEEGSPGYVLNPSQVAALDDLAARAVRSAEERIAKLEAERDAAIESAHELIGELCSRESELRITKMSHARSESGLTDRVQRRVIERLEAEREAVNSALADLDSDMIDCHAFRDRIRAVIHPGEAP